MKKVLVGVLAVMLVVVFTVPAFAVGATKSAKCSSCGATVYRTCLSEYSSGGTYACSIKSGCQYQSRRGKDYYYCSCGYDKYGSHSHGMYHTKGCAGYGCAFE